MVKESKYTEKKVTDSDFDEFFDIEIQNHDSKFHQLQKLMAYYRCAIMEITTKFNVLNEEFSLRYDRNPISGIKSRLKQLPSL